MRGIGCAIRCRRAPVKGLAATMLLVATVRVLTADHGVAARDLFDHAATVRTSAEVLLLPILVLLELGHSTLELLRSCSSCPGELRRYMSEMRLALSRRPLEPTNSNLTRLVACY